MAPHDRNGHGPHIVVTEADGTTTSLLIPRNRTIRVNPITGLDQVVTTGDNAERTDQRTPQVIWTDQTGGMGSMWYVETEGITSFRNSTADTRYPGLIVLPPLPVSLGVTGLFFGLPSHVEYLGVTNAYVLAWVRRKSSTTSARRNSTGTTWATITTGGTGISQLTAFEKYRGYYLFGTLNNTIGLYTSTDGVTWANSAKAKAISGLCTHDNKIYAYNSTDNTLDWHDDPTAADASWTKSAALRLEAGEVVHGLIEWRDRVGRTAVFVLSSQCIRQYDEDADTFLEYDDYSDIATAATGMLIAETHSDGNLYVIVYDNTNAFPNVVFWYSGTENQAGYNRRGGLATSEQISQVALKSGRRWLYDFGPTPATASGHILAMNDQQQFSKVYTSTQGQLNGGGYSQGKGFALVADGPLTSIYCDEVPLPDNDDSPLFADRTYAASATHEYALTDGGTPNMPKQALWVEVQCLTTNGAKKTPGLNGTTQVQVQYALDTDTSWTTIGTLTNASTFPARLPINSGFGVKFKQIALRLLLSTSTSTLTPVVTSVALAYVRQEIPRYAYTVPVTLRDRDHPLYRNKSIAGQLAALNRWTQPGALVRLDIAGGDETSAPSTSVTVPNCTVAYSGELDPETGMVDVMIQFGDFSPPASG